MVISLRDGDSAIERHVAALDIFPAMSIVTRIELEGGLDIEPEEKERRRMRLDALVAALPVLQFGDAEAEMYRTIIDAVGYSRTKTLDRMIAAQALASGLVLVTANVRDFRMIPGLRIESWAN